MSIAMRHGISRRRACIYCGSVGASLTVSQTLDVGSRQVLPLDLSI